MRSNRDIEKIIWGVDAFEAGSLRKSKLSQVLRALAAATKAEIEPVYLLNPNAVSGGSMMSPGELRAVARSVQVEMESALHEMRIPNLNLPRVIIEHHDNIKGTVKAFHQYVENSDADLLVVATHGRSGVQRWTLGSFAESLLQQSQVPVLTVSPNVVHIHNFSRILYLTDFSKHAEAAFGRVVSLARSLSAEIVIFHKTHPTGRLESERDVVSYDDLKEAVPPAWAASWSERRQWMEEYVGRAEQAGISAMAFLDVGGLPLLNSIERAVDKLKTQLIATPSHGGEVHPTLRETSQSESYGARAAPCGYFERRRFERSYTRLNPRWYDARRKRRLR